MVWKSVLKHWMKMIKDQTNLPYQLLNFYFVCVCLSMPSQPETQPFWYYKLTQPDQNSYDRFCGKIHTENFFSSFIKKKWDNTSKSIQDIYIILF